MAFTIEDTISAPARCTARFGNLAALEGGGAGYRYFGLQDFDFGERLTVWQGVPPNTLFRLFDGRIHLIEGAFGAGTAPEIVLQEEDALQELRMRQRTRIFHHMSDATIIEEIAPPPTGHGVRGLGMERPNEAAHRSGDLGQRSPLCSGGRSERWAGPGGGLQTAAADCGGRRPRHPRGGKESGRGQAPGPVRRVHHGPGDGPTSPRSRGGAHRATGRGGPPVQRTYQVSTVRHLFDQKTGLRTEFEVRRPRIAPTPPPPAGSRRGAEPREARPRITEIPSERWYGVYPALVIDHRDPEQRGRVKVTLPWVPDAGGISGIEKGREYDGWARLATLAARPDRGSWFLPDVDDEVLVSFEAGIPSRPVVVGALWNGKDTPPVVADEGNTVKLLRTRGGSEIRFHDQEGEETVEIRTAGGQSIRLANAQGGTVQISDSHGNSVALGAKGIVLDSAAGIQLNASTVALSAGSVSIDAGMVTSSGVVKCDTLITNAVVANSYTPGAGKIW